MKFILFVEGDTERRALSGFLKRWLDSKVSPPVGIQTVDLGNNAKLVKEAPKRARMYLESPECEEIVAVIGLLDLYECPLEFPKDKTGVRARFDWAKAEMERRVGQEKYRQFFAVHETEAWLLSQPNIFPEKVRSSLPQKKPEEINFKNPPAKRLEAIYQKQIGTGYKKTVDGSSLFQKLDPAIACAQCPFLKQMLDEMLRLAQAEQPDRVTG